MKHLNRNHWIAVVIALQIIALAFIAAKREWIHKNGTTVYLRTAPVDPRDYFRGDYLQLDYDIGQPEASLLEQPWLETEALQDQQYRQVYLQLEQDEQGIANLVGIHQQKPAGLFIKGHIEPGFKRWGNNTFIKLGIEKYFVEQGSGLALEQQRGQRNEWQTPMEMEIALGNDGTAVIRGHRWSAMGIRLEVLEAGQPVANLNTPDSDASHTAAARHSAKLRISVRNQSGKPLYFIDSAHHCGFLLMENTYIPAGSGQALTLVPTPNRNCDDTVEWQQHLLAENAIYTFDIDLAEPLWHVNVAGQTKELGLLQNRWQGYRWLYRLPDIQRKTLEKRHDAWLSSLRSTRFNAGGNID